jgi:hypothetical protein
MTPDLSQISVETRRAYRYAGGDPKNAMWLWEFHNGHRKGFPLSANTAKAGMLDARLDRAFYAVEHLGHPSVRNVANHLRMDAGMARDVLNTLEQQGRLNKRQIDHVSRYSIKHGVSAVLGAQAAGRASTVQVCGVSLYRMDVTG